MDTHEVIRVNHMGCETLDPTHGTALLYKELEKIISITEKNKLIQECNKKITQKYFNPFILQTDRIEFY